MTQAEKRRDAELIYRLDMERNALRAALRELVEAGQAMYDSEKSPYPADREVRARNAERGFLEALKAAESLLRMEEEKGEKA